MARSGKRFFCGQEYYKKHVEPIMIKYFLKPDDFIEFALSRFLAWGKDRKEMVEKYEHAIETQRDVIEKLKEMYEKHTGLKVKEIENYKDF